MFYLRKKKETQKKDITLSAVFNLCNLILDDQLIGIDIWFYQADSFYSLWRVINTLVVQ